MKMAVLDTAWRVANGTSWKAAGAAALNEDVITL